jgi:two-component system, sensor histidine kinase and response regulator
MDDFLVKPYDELQIADMLGRWLTPITGVPNPPTEIAAPERLVPSPSFEAPRLDMVAVDRVRRISDDDGSSMLAHVVSQFAATSEPLLATMRSKSCDSDPDSVRRAAHSLKSSAAALGARRVSQCCEEIEALARDNGILPSEALLAALEAELRAATDALKALAGAEQSVV